MSVMRVVRPTEVNVYRCDAHEITGCEEICDKAGTSYPDGCDWVRFDAWDQLRELIEKAPWSEEAQLGRLHGPDRLWFHNYACLARWAYLQACHRGELDCTDASTATQFRAEVAQADQRLRMGVATYGKAA